MEGGREGGGREEGRKDCSQGLNFTLNNNYYVIVEEFLIPEFEIVSEWSVYLLEMALSLSLSK